MTRGYINAQPNVALANTGSGAAGTLTGPERLKLQSLIAAYSITAPLQLSGNALLIPAATAAQNGYATAAQIAKLDGIAAGAEVNPAEAERLATPAQSGIMSAAFADKLTNIHASFAETFAAGNTLVSTYGNVHSIPIPSAGTYLVWGNFYIAHNTTTGHTMYGRFVWQGATTFGEKQQPQPGVGLTIDVGPSILVAGSAGLMTRRRRRA